MNELKRTYNKAKRMHENMKEVDYRELVALNMDMVNINSKMKNSTKNKLYLDTCKEILNTEGEFNIFHEGFLVEHQNLCDFYMAIKSAAFLPYPKQPLHMEKLERELFLRLFGVSYDISQAKKENPEYVYSDCEAIEYLSDLYGVWSADTKHEYFIKYAEKALKDIKGQASIKDDVTSFTK